MKSHMTSHMTSHTKSHTLPFENRWTSSARAWQWNCELERFGVANVRAMFADHETHHAEERTIIFDIPAGFVRDWLAFHDRQTARQQRLWWLAVIALAVAAAAVAVIGALRVMPGLIALALAASIAAPILPIAA